MSLYVQLVETTEYYPHCRVDSQTILVRDSSAPVKVTHEGHEQDNTSYDTVVRRIPAYIPPAGLKTISQAQYQAQRVAVLERHQEIKRAGIKLAAARKTGTKKAVAANETIDEALDNLDKAGLMEVAEARGIKVFKSWSNDKILAAIQAG